MNFIISGGLVLFWASVVNSYGVPCPYQWGKVQCTNTNDCIPRSWECDGIKDDCPGNTDEKDCPSCAGIYCDCNDTFVPWTKVCNFWPDCKDASDEDASKYGCDCRGFKCSVGYCIPTQWRCDHFLDCWPTGEDEIGCPCDGPDLFQCGTFGPCLYNVYKCDGFKQCPNGEDEQNCPCAFQCADGSCLVQSYQICNGWVDCPGGEDELNCPCSTTQFPCETLNNTCVPWELRCNCFPDCPDGTDELNCLFSPPSPLPPGPEPPGPGGPSGPGSPSFPGTPNIPGIPAQPTNPELKKILSAREGALKRGP